MPRKNAYTLVLKEQNSGKPNVERVTNTKALVVLRNSPHIFVFEKNSREPNNLNVKDGLYTGLVGWMMRSVLLRLQAASRP